MHYFRLSARLRTSQTILLMVDKIGVSGPVLNNLPIETSKIKLL